jgi:hypothetical protein
MFIDIIPSTNQGQTCPVDLRIFLMTWCRGASREGACRHVGSSRASSWGDKEGGHDFYGAIEIVDLPPLKMVIFYGDVMGVNPLFLLYKAKQTAKITMKGVACGIPNPYGSRYLQPPKSYPSHTPWKCNGIDREPYFTIKCLENTWINQETGQVEQHVFGVQAKFRAWWKPCLI